MTSLRYPTSFTPLVAGRPAAVARVPGASVGAFTAFKRAIKIGDAEPAAGGLVKQRQGRLKAFGAAQPAVQGQNERSRPAFEAGGCVEVEGAPVDREGDAGARGVCGGGGPPAAGLQHEERQERDGEKACPGKSLAVMEVPSA